MSKDIKAFCQPDSKGFFGAYGGQYVPDAIKARLDELDQAFKEALADPEFTREMQRLLLHFAGRPSPVFHCRNLSKKLGGAQIWLKREDLNHLGAHKVNNTIGQCLLAKRMGKTRVIAETGADAVILQDPAVMRLFRDRYPALPRHASTQTAVHDLDGALYLQDLGCETIVLARELTLSEMEKIASRLTTAGAEAFVHGAHCMSVSGACYLSAMLGGRSGNRGLCAQPCRLDWRCGKGDHVLSLKDMSLLRHAQEMADAGITTFKIEGRMKRPEYVAAVVTACREALALEPYDEDTLRAVFSRSGFTDGYLTGKRDKTMFGYRTKDDVQSADKVLKSLAALYEKETPRVGVSMAFSLTETESALTVSDGENACTVTGDAPEKAINRALDAASAEKNLVKTGGTPFAVADFTDRHRRWGETDAEIAAALTARAGTEFDPVCVEAMKTLLQ